MGKLLEICSKYQKGNSYPYMKSAVILICMLSLIGAFFVSTIREGHDWGGDFSMYIMHAKNISQGHAYVDTGYIYNSSFARLGPKRYPPVFPIFLSVVHKFLGFNLTAMKIEGILFFLLGLLFIYAVLSKHLFPQYSLLIVLIIGFNPYFWQIKDQIIPDIPFLFFTYLTIFLVNKLYLSEKNKMLDVVLVGVLVYLSYALRTVGIVFIPALFIYDFIKNKRVRILPFKITSIFLVLALLQHKFLASNSSYLDNIRFSISIIAHNIFNYLKSFIILWENGYSDIFRNVLFILVSLCAVLGYFSLVRKKLSFSEIFFFVYFLIIILWSFEGIRLLIPIIPLYILYILIGLKDINKFLKQKQLILFGLFIFVIFISYAGKYTSANWGPIEIGIQKQESTELFKYIKENTDKEDVLVFIKPRVLSLMTERRSAVYHEQDHGGELLTYFKEINASYLIAYPDRDIPYLSTFIENHKSHFEEVYSNADFIIYKLKYG
ncbi:glycosyltransferase family 39 protein [Acidobacteriota bacterium]